MVRLATVTGKNIRWSNKAIADASRVAHKKIAIPLRITKLKLLASEKLLDSKKVWRSSTVDIFVGRLMHSDIIRYKQQQEHSLDAQHYW